METGFVDGFSEKIRERANLKKIKKATLVE